MKMLVSNSVRNKIQEAFCCRLKEGCDWGAVMRKEKSPSCSTEQCTLLPEPGYLFIMSEGRFHTLFKLLITPLKLLIHC